MAGSWQFTACFTLKTTGFLLPLWSMSLHICIFCTQNTYILHWQSVYQNSDQTVWTSKVVERTKRWFLIVPPTQFVTSGDACIRCHPEVAPLGHPVSNTCCLGGSSRTVAQQTSASYKTTLTKGLSLHFGLIENCCLGLYHSFNLSLLSLLRVLETFIPNLFPGYTIYRVHKTKLSSMILLIFEN